MLHYFVWVFDIVLKRLYICVVSQFSMTLQLTTFFILVRFGAILSKFVKKYTFLKCQNKLSRKLDVPLLKVQFTFLLTPFFFRKTFTMIIFDIFHSVKSFVIRIIDSTMIRLISMFPFHVKFIYFSFQNPFYFKCILVAFMCSFLTECWYYLILIHVFNYISSWLRVF